MSDLNESDEVTLVATITVHYTVACNDKISADLDNDDLYDQLSQTGEAHGVEHVWAGDIGWATWTDKCLAERHDGLYEAVEDLKVTPGRYPVLVSFEDGEYLRLRLAEGEAAA